MKPTISAAILNYNGAAYFPRALQAILQQTYQPVEILIVDDASTDESMHVIEKAIAHLPQARLIRHEKNKGVIASLNEIYQTVKGEFCYPLGVDDYIVPTFFEASISALEKAPGVGFCCSIPVVFETRIPSQLPFYPFSVEMYTPQRLAKTLCRTNLWIAGHTCVCRVEYVRKVGGFSSDMELHCDWFLMHLLAFKYGMVYLKQPLAFWRIDPYSYSNRQRSEAEYCKIYQAIFEGVKRHSEVKKYFRKSAALIHCGKRARKFAERSPKYWRFFLPIKRRILSEKWFPFLFDLEKFPLVRFKG